MKQYGANDNYNDNKYDAERHRRFISTTFAPTAYSRTTARLFTTLSSCIARTLVYAITAVQLRNINHTIHKKGACSSIHYWSLATGHAARALIRLRAYRRRRENAICALVLISPGTFLLISSWHRKNCASNVLSIVLPLANYYQNGERRQETCLVHAIKIVQSSS